MKKPNGKTGAHLAHLAGDVQQTLLKRWDYGFIDGYVIGANGSPLAVFVRLPDGCIDMVPINAIICND